MTVVSKPKYSTPAQLTITLASLASSTTGVGRQSTLVDNSTAQHTVVHVYGKFVTNGSDAPTAGKSIFIYLIKGDGTRRTDGAGATDEALTRKTATLLRTIPVTADLAANYDFDLTIYDPGPEWGLLVTQDTEQTLNDNDNAIYYVGEQMEHE